MKDVYGLSVIVIDTHTGEAVYRTTYDKRHLARQVRERKNQDYGAYRFIAWIGEVQESTICRVLAKESK